MAIRKIIEIDKEKCTACGECIPSCAEHALFIEDNELKIREDKLCDGLGACLNHCPHDALKIIEREADAFDEKAVENFVQCSSVKEEKNTSSQYAHNWPVKLALVSSKVSFLESDRICIAADCAAFACASFHKRYMQNCPILISCPRLEDKEKIVEKFVELFQNKKTMEIDIVRMEVPCCVLPDLIQKAINKIGFSEKPKINLHILTRNGQELFLSPITTLK